MLNVRHCDWMIDVLLVSILVLDVHRVQAEVDLDILLQVVRRFMSVLSFRFYFLGIRNFFNSFFFTKNQLLPLIIVCVRLKAKELGIT